MRRAWWLSLLFVGCLEDDRHRPPQRLEACAAKQQPVTGTAGVVSLLDAVPGADPPCFIAALPRPLNVVATSSITSAQPASGMEAPRLLVLLDGVVVSVVGAGDGAPLLELGEWVSTTRTRKGELHLPMASPIPADAPWARVRMSDTATTCGLCHRGEQPDDLVPGAFTSLAFKPDARSDVTLDALHRIHNGCSQPDAGPGCELMHALFDFGAVNQGAFADAVTTFSVP